jgi:hypothetical protein
LIRILVFQQTVKLCSKQRTYRSGEPLRHPRAKSRSRSRSKPKPKPKPSAKATDLGGRYRGITFRKARKVGHPSAESNLPKGNRAEKQLAEKQWLELFGRLLGFGCLQTLF